jgi:sulfoxide reductase catalytic subunit YedY
MLIKSTQSSTCKENQVTDESVYLGRRQLLKNMGFVGAGALLSPYANSFDLFSDKKIEAMNTRKLKFQTSPASDLILTPEKKVTTYNNFYEFGASKNQPAELAQNFKVDPWKLTISGEVEETITLDYDDLFSRFPLEERIYRMRCVEAWSMVIPWVGFELNKLLKLAKPTSKAKYVAFKTLYDPEQMPGQRSRHLGGGINYPYVEGLRMDEAMHPLTMMSVGLYGKTLPPQNGAPIRLVVPWKYGFKGIKSIVGIELVEKMPATTWTQLASSEYGFYANVNPQVSHPRWSQASERRITTGGLFRQNRIETLMFNGYGEEVASLYQNMNLRKFY